VEHTLVELKAKVDDLDSLRKKLTDLKAQHIGTFQQIDVYFDTPKGRLKLRETEGDHRAKLVYYERENIAGPKRSNVFILEIEEPVRLKRLLEKALKTMAIVDKTREIYRLHIFGERMSRVVRVHLDSVKGLGSFLEFEMEATPRAFAEDRAVLLSLMKKLGISEEDLEASSYCDLVRNI
jgi:predicted adenylyl cyclase CyaB